MSDPFSRRGFLAGAGGAVVGAGLAGRGVAATPPAPAEKAPVDLVDPFIGAITTTSDGATNGKTFPGATTPFGLVQLSPDTVSGGDNGSGYSWEMDTIEGFSFLHLLDVALSYQYCRNVAMGSAEQSNRTDFANWTKLGYCSDSNSISSTLENCYTDYALARYAEKLGHAAELRRTSANYRNIFDTGIGWFRGRNADGSWMSPDAGCIESNPNQQAGMSRTTSRGWPPWSAASRRSSRSSTPSSRRHRRRR